MDVERLLSFPPEILIMIGEEMSDGDLNAVLRAGNRHLTVLLQPVLRVRHDPRIPLLCYAARNNNMPLIHRLLPQHDINETPAIRGYDEKFYGWTPLRFAAHFSRTQACHLLLMPGAHPDVPGSSGLADHDFALWPALHDAAFRGDVGIIELLIACGAEIEAQFHWTLTFWCTPLMFAVLKGHYRAAEVLLQNDADANIVNEDDAEDKVFRPVHPAALRGYDRIFDLLLKHGADRMTLCSLIYAPDDPPTYGFTPLHVAVAYNNSHMVEYLLKQLSVEQVNRSSWAGETALVTAIREGSQTKIIKMLLNAGARTWIGGAPEWLLDGAAADGYDLIYGYLKHNDRSALEEAVELADRKRFQLMLDHPVTVAQQYLYPDTFLQHLRDVLQLAEHSAKKCAEIMPHATKRANKIVEMVRARVAMMEHDALEEKKK